MAHVRVLEVVIPAQDRRVADRRAVGGVARPAAAGARVVEPTRGAGVVRVIHVRIDVAAQVRAGVDGLEIADLAVHGPGGARELVPVPRRHERAFLERLQRRETEAHRELHWHSFCIEVLVALLDQDVPVVVDLVKPRQAQSLVGSRVLRALDEIVVVVGGELGGVRRAVGARAAIDVRIAGERGRNVVDVAAPTFAVEDAPDREFPRDQRHIQHRIRARVRIAVRRRAVAAFGAALGDVELRLVRDVAKRARFGAAAEQRALRAFEHLDALHIDHVDVEITAREGQRLLVEVSRDVRERVDRSRGLTASEADREAAHVDVALTRAVGAEGHIRQ